jgi:hypothetical protein
MDHIDLTMNSSILKIECIKLCMVLGKKICFISKLYILCYNERHITKRYCTIFDIFYSIMHVRLSRSGNKALFYILNIIYNQKWKIKLLSYKSSTLQDLWYITCGNGRLLVGSQLEMFEIKSESSTKGSLISPLKEYGDTDKISFIRRQDCICKKIPRCVVYLIMHYECSLFN